MSKRSREPEVSILRLPWWAASSEATGRKGAPAVGAEIVPRLLLTNTPQDSYRASWYRIQRGKTDELLLVGSSLYYTPTAADLGCHLMLEVAPLSDDGKVAGPCRSAQTAVVVAYRPMAPPDRVLHKCPAPAPSGGASGGPRSGCCSASEPLRVVSYNILADALASERVHTRTPPWALRWDYRRSLLLAELRELAETADVLCLQEVEEPMFADICALLAPCGFVGAHALKKEMPVRENGIEGVATFWRAERLYALDVRTVVIADGLRDGAASAAFRSARPCDGVKVPLQEKGHVAQLLALRCVRCAAAAAADAADASSSSSSSSEDDAGGGGGDDLGGGLCLANTHLFWSPESPQLKAAQAVGVAHALGALRAELERAEGGCWPVALCGDMNALPSVDQRSGSGVYTVLRSGMLAASHDDHPAHAHGAEARSDVPALTQPLALRSAYERVTGSDPAFTTCSADFTGTLDYIWYEMGSLRPVNALVMPSEQAVTEYGALPSHVFPSDHLPLLASFERCAD